MADTSTTVSKIKLPDGKVYNIDAATINGHSVNADVPADIIPITKDKDIFDILEEEYPNGGAGLHNSIYRGKDLGTLTDAHHTAIQNQTYKGLWLGDYVTIDGVTYIFGAFGWQTHIGDNQDPGGNALVITAANLLKPDGSSTHYMNDVDTVPSNGYIGTKMWTSTLPNQVLPVFKKAFGTHLFTHRELLCNGQSNGSGTSCSWYDVTVNIPNQVMVYGEQTIGQGNYGDIYQVGSRHQILPLFIARPDLVTIRANYWLSDITAGSNFARVTDVGNASAGSSSNAWFGVRPYAIID